MVAPSTHEIPLDPKYDNYDYPTVSPYPQSGYPGHTTADQDAKVYQLRMMLEQAGCTERLDTLTMLRFLRARKFNVELSKQMFLDCEKWRKEFQGGVDNLVRNFDYPEKAEIFKYYPQYYHKTDKDGRPLYIEQIGGIDLTAMYKITTADRMLSNLVCEYEKVADPRLPACSRKAGALQETCCTIMDLKGVGIAKAGSVYSYIQSASAISQNYYPERLGKLYIINAPWGFSSVFSVIKRFLDPVTVAKIHVLGSGFKSELLQQIPPQNLPKHFGGACECEGGCMFSDLGPWKEAEYTREPAWASKPKTEEAQPSVGTEQVSVENPAPAVNGGSAAPEQPEIVQGPHVPAAQ